VKLLLDQDLYAVTARLLAEKEHEVTRVAELGLARADDSTLLSVAKARESLLVTRTVTTGIWFLSSGYRQE
jgi:predicted nuclease of predicted toxin-antitoxin system